MIPFPTKSLYSNRNWCEPCLSQCCTHVNPALESGRRFWSECESEILSQFFEILKPRWNLFYQYVKKKSPSISLSTFCVPFNLPHPFNLPYHLKSSIFTSLSVNLSLKLICHAFHQIRFFVKWLDTIL